MDTHQISQGGSKKEILFPNGNRAQWVAPPAGAKAADILNALGIGQPKALIMISGGAAGLDEALKSRLAQLFSHGIARAAADTGALIIDGGTQAGVMQMIGEGRAAWGGNAPLIGVCPAALVTWPDGPAGEDLASLEPNHTHFVLTDGDHWGAETETMFALATGLSEGTPSVSVLANGGPISRDEVLHNVRQRREIIVIAGSGRLADELTAVVRREAEPADADMAKVLRDGRITLFEISQAPSALADLVAQKIDVK